MKLLTTLHCDRLEYSKRCIDSLLSLHGIEDYLVLMIAEPVDYDVVSLLKSAPFKNSKVIVNHKKLGCNLATRKALELSCELSDFFLYVEDDILLAKDTLEYIETVKDKAEYHSFYQRHWTKENINSGISHKSFDFSYRRDFNSWGWAAYSGFVSKILASSNICNKDCPFCNSKFMNLMTPPEQGYNGHYDFLEIPDNLKLEIQKGSYHRTWDIHFREYLSTIQWNGTVSCIGRSNNIGALNGVNMNDINEHKNQQHVEYWRENWPHELL